MAFLTPLILLLKNSKSVRKALTPGLVSSVILSSLFIALRKLKPICQYFNHQSKDECVFDWVSVEFYVVFLRIG